MKISIIGTGYVGLVSGACLASKNHKVTCFDLNHQVIKNLKNGICNIYEKDLESKIIKNTKNLFFEVLNHSTQENLLDADVIMIAVGTPSLEGEANLSQVESVARMLGSLLKSSDKFISIIIKSTVPPGTTDSFFKKIFEEESQKKIGEYGLGMNPEFLREGSAIDDFLNPDRIIFGYEDDKTRDVLCEIYKSWSCEKILTNTRTAEMTKYVNNALLATLISSINEYSNISRSLGNIDFNKVIQGVHSDNRWNARDKSGNLLSTEILNYLKPGCGYGGSCFPKDLAAITSLAKDVGIEPKILNAVQVVNENQPQVIIDILKKSVGDISNKKVLLLGLSFKPETDDVRESISVKLIEQLQTLVKKISAHDPVAIKNAKNAISNNCSVEFIDDWIRAIPDIDIIIIATNWKEYTELINIQNKLKGKVLFDTRSFLSITGNKDFRYLTTN